MEITAAVLTRVGFPLEIKRLTTPQLLPGQVLVKILFSGVCRSQLMEVKGWRGKDKWLPHMLGHEGSGKVVDIGAGVSKVQPGDDVILGWLKGHGLEAEGAKYKCGEETINSGPVTTFSNYSIVSENRLIKKPSNLLPDHAVLYGCALPTGAGIVLNQLNVNSHSKVVVIGLGGIGLAALLMLHAKGVKDIVAVDVSDEKLMFAKKIGINQLFNISEKAEIEKLQKYAGAGTDYCIESAGLIETIELGFSLIKKHGGKLVFASHPPDGQHIKILPHDLISGKEILGTWGGNANPDVDIPKIHQILMNSAVNYNKVLNNRYKLENINQALYDLEVGRVFRPLIVMHHDI